MLAQVPNDDGVCARSRISALDRLLIVSRVLSLQGLATMAAHLLGWLAVLNPALQALHDVDFAEAISHATRSFSMLRAWSE